MIEVPIYFLIALVVLVMTGAVLVITQTVAKAKAEEKYQAVAKATSTVRQKLASDMKHGLRRVWFTGSQWNWTCECGHGGKVTCFDMANPSEEKAIKQWRSHVEVHERLVLPTNELSHQECDRRFVGLWSLFEKYRTACYCQTTSNDLILLNQEAKKFAPKEIESVSEEA